VNACSVLKHVNFKKLFNRNLANAVVLKHIFYAVRILNAWANIKSESFT